MIARRLTVSAIAVAVGSLLSPAPAPAVEPPFANRAFSVSAEAFPVEPSPGTQDTELGIRASSTRASVTNPPLGGYAQATAVDLGLAEAYFGSQGPSASADTATEGDDHVEVSEGGTNLEVHVDRSPFAWSRAEGNAVGDAAGGLGTAVSRSSADGSGSRLLATAESVVEELVVGPLVIGSARFRAEAELDGTPGGARASAVLEVVDATLGGVPVVIDDRGVAVNDARVPAPLLEEATAALQQMVGPGGYVDLRVVQPRTEVAEDGTRARAWGGGIRLHMTSNDPTNHYFLTTTLLGGATEVFLGADLGVPTPDPPPRLAPTIEGPPPASMLPGSAPVVEGFAGAEPPSRRGPAPVDLAHAAGRDVLALESRWPLGWLLLPLGLAWLAVGILRLGPAEPVRRRLLVVADHVADRYVRG